MNRRANPVGAVVLIVASEIVLAAATALGVMLGNHSAVSYASPNVSECEYSNGNSDGSPCNYQDSDGRWSANGSSDYRNRR